ncbi:MAG TPA: biotin transporter BioY [Desulfobacteria bacterium]|nr:biotin transporter BioY [Desulfobacteria bacterium]
MSKKLELKDFIYSALCTAIIIVLGLIAVPLPFSPVPVTGQTLGVMLAGSILTVRQAILSISTFLLLGIVGAPVFAGGTGGPGIIAGPRGGYLIGFLVGAVVIAFLKGKNNKILRLVLANAMGGIAIIYFFGILWLSYVTKVGISQAFTIGALPYLPGDIFKVIIASVLAVKLNPHLRRQAG